MIITKTPLRITFTGGGSDMPSFFNNYEGHCINATIDKYVYVLVKKRDDNKIYLKYSDNEVVDISNIKDIKHDFIRETLLYLNIDYGLEIINWADIPTKGSGLGSSGSFLVGLLNAIHHLQGNDISKKTLAEQASYIEMILCKKPIGYQDQYAAAFGGLNEISFSKKNNIEINKINLDYNLLTDNLLLLYTNITRNSSVVLEKQNKNLCENKEVIESMELNVELSRWLSKKLKNNMYCEVANALKTNWELKKKFSNNVVNEEIEKIYNRGIMHGASSGKIIGAGGGGFIMFYVDSKYRKNFIESFYDYKCMRFNIDNYGSRVLLNLGE